MKVGDKVRVFRRDENETIHCVHRGILITTGTTGGKVWDEKSETDFPTKAEWFPFKAPRLWMIPM